MQSKISVVLDAIFFSVIAFLISFAVMKIFITQDIVCALLSLIIFLLSLKAILPKSFKEWNKKYSTKHEQKHMEKCIFALQSMENDSVLHFFEELFAKNYKVTRNKNFLIIDDKLLVAFDYLSEKNEKRFILEAYIEATKMNIPEIAIFTEKQSEDSNSYADKLQNISIYFFDSAETYALMKTYNHFSADKDFSITKKPFAGLKNMSLSKKKARSFLFTSFILYFSSLFIPFTSYYLIFAALALVLSIICFTKSDSGIQPTKSYLYTNKNN